jgi:hypothetical protein
LGNNGQDVWVHRAYDGDITIRYRRDLRDPETTRMCYSNKRLGVGFAVLVDTNIVDQIKRQTWIAKMTKTKHGGYHFYLYLTKRKYGQFRGCAEWDKIRLHRYVLQWNRVQQPAPAYYTVDHMDRNTLNNRLRNLRWATRSMQGLNRDRWARSKNVFK